MGGSRRILSLMSPQYPSFCDNPDLQVCSSLSQQITVPEP